MGLCCGLNGCEQAAGQPLPLQSKLLPCRITCMLRGRAGEPGSCPNRQLPSGLSGSEGESTCCARRGTWEEEEARERWLPAGSVLGAKSWEL